jgi:hypothetical protein
MKIKRKLRKYEFRTEQISESFANGKARCLYVVINIKSYLIETKFVCSLNENSINYSVCGPFVCGNYDTAVRSSEPVKM